MQPAWPIPAANQGHMPEAEEEQEQQQAEEVLRLAKCELHLASCTPG
jgi:hypothetical protein